MRILAFLIILLGGALIAFGVAYRLPLGGYAFGGAEIPLLQEGAGIVKDAYAKSPLFKQQDDMLQIKTYGLLLVLAGPGGALLLLGLLMAIFGGGKKAPKPKKAKKAEKAPIPAPQSAAQQAAAPAAAAAVTGGESSSAASAGAGAADLSDLDNLLGDGGGGAAAPGRRDKQAGTFFIPDELLDDEITNKNMFYDIDRIVSISQSSVGEKHLKLAVHVLRPEYLPFLDALSDTVKERLGRQIFGYHVLRLKREEQDISPDQFILQDKRMREAERETICRRFLPENPDDFSGEAREKIGQVFTLFEHSRVQQSTMSQAEDWQDISLRNFAEIMKMPAGKGE